MCNLNLKLCETGKIKDDEVVKRFISAARLVDPDRVNWFVYDFEVRTELFKDQKFVQTFKK